MAVASGSLGREGRRQRPASVAIEPQRKLSRGQARELLPVAQGGHRQLTDAAASAARAPGEDASTGLAAADEPSLVLDLEHVIDDETRDRALEILAESRPHIAGQLSGVVQREEQQGGLRRRGSRKRRRHRSVAVARRRRPRPPILRAAPVRLPRVGRVGRAHIAGWHGRSRARARSPGRCPDPHGNPRRGERRRSTCRSRAVPRLPALPS